MKKLLTKLPENSTDKTYLKALEIHNVSEVGKKIIVGDVPVALFRFYFASITKIVKDKRGYKKSFLTKKLSDRKLEIYCTSNQVL